MSGPLSPRLLRGGIILIDPASGAVQRVISLQYNPETLTGSMRMMPPNRRRIHERPARPPPAARRHCARR